MIFAVDFDGTIFSDDPSAIGEMPGAIATMKELQALGHKIIIWTCRCEPHLSSMTRWLSANGFTPDAVNNNLVLNPGFGIPKILADFYIDDKSFPPFTGWESVRRAFL